MLIPAKTGLTFSFNMGVEPKRLTQRLAEKMLKAGVVQLTVPFESSDPRMLRRFRKPYRFDVPVRVMAMIREIGFDMRGFHATSLFGYDDEDSRHLFRIYTTMVLFGGQPIFFPINPVPQSEEYERSMPLIAGKPQDELNGYLFPLLASKEKVELYDLIIMLGNEKSLERAVKLARQLPQELEREFFEELERASTGMKGTGA